MCRYSTSTMLYIPVSVPVPLPLKKHQNWYQYLCTILYWTVPLQNHKIETTGIFHTVPEQWQALSEYIWRCFTLSDKFNKHYKTAAMWQKIDSGKDHRICRPEGKNFVGGAWIYLKQCRYINFKKIVVI